MWCKCVIQERPWGFYRILEQPCVASVILVILSGMPLRQPLRDKHTAVEEQTRSSYHALIKLFATHNFPQRNYLAIQSSAVFVLSAHSHQSGSMVNRAAQMWDDSSSRQSECFRCVLGLLHCPNKDQTHIGVCISGMQVIMCCLCLFEPHKTEILKP